MKCLTIKCVTAFCIVCLFAGCGEVDTKYTISGNSQRNMRVIAIVNSTAERLRLRLDNEGASSTWRSYSRGSLSYDLATEPGAPTNIFLADGRLTRKHDFNRVKEDLTYGLRRIDPKMQMNTRWITNPMM